MPPAQVVWPEFARTQVDVLFLRLVATRPDEMGPWWLRKGVTVNPCVHRSQTQLIL